MGAQVKFGLLACLIAIGNFIQAQPVVPQTIAGRQLSKWLTVFSNGNQDRFVSYIDSNFHSTLLDQTSAYYRAERIARTYSDVRRFQVQVIERSSQFEIDVLATSTLTGLWFRIIMRTDSLAPHKISQYSTQRIPPPVNTRKKLTETDLVKTVSAFMSKLAGEDAFSGTILLANKNKVLFQKSYGLASKAHQVSNRVSTRLNIASIGKMFTAVAIAQLMEQKKISLSDTVGKFLPAYSNAQVRKLTIHHLLSHSSGMGDFHGPKYVAVKGSLRQVKDWIPLFEHDSLSFEPGLQWQYSNAGYILLGAIIEKISGRNYFDYIRDNIFHPLGMNNTAYDEADQDMPNTATGYTNYIDYGEDYQEFHLGDKRNTSLYIPARGNPQGGAYSTLADLFKFSRALETNKLISQKTFQVMTSNKVFARKYDAGDTYWGYGFELESSNGYRVIGHGGGDLGISAAVRTYPDAGGYTVIILSNYDRGGIIAIAKLQELITMQH